MNYTKLINKIVVEKNRISYFVHAFGVEYLNEIIHALNYEDMLEICKILGNINDKLCCHYCDDEDIYSFQLRDYADFELKEISNDTERIFEEQDAFSDRLKNLRIDENNASDTLKKLTAALRDTERRLHKANIPGIPDDIESRLSEADEQLFVADQKLKAVPLDMPDVFEAVKTAELAVTETTKQVDSTIEDVKLVELLIQYGNRYRTTKPGMNDSLVEAEDAFNNMRYAKALEIIAKAVEKAEPGALKKMEALVDEVLSK